MTDQITAGLKVITNLTSLTLIVESALSGVVTSPTSVVADVLVSMKTPSHLPAISYPSLTSVSVTPPTVMIVKPGEVLSTGITRSLGVI